LLVIVTNVGLRLAQGGANPVPASSQDTLSGRFVLTAGHGICLRRPDRRLNDRRALATEHLIDTAGHWRCGRGEGTQSTTAGPLVDLDTQAPSLAGGQGQETAPARTTSCLCPSMESGRARSQRLASPPWCSSGSQAPCLRRKQPWVQSDGCSVPSVFPPLRSELAADRGGCRDWCCNPPRRFTAAAVAGGRTSRSPGAVPIVLPIRASGN